MFKPENAQPATSVEEKKHHVIIENNGQIIFNSVFHSDQSKIINRDVESVFSLYPVKDNGQEKIIISFADESEMGDAEDYQEAKELDANLPKKLDDDGKEKATAKIDSERNKAGYFILESTDLKKGAKVALRNMFAHSIPNKGYRWGFDEGEGLELNHEKRYITLDLKQAKPLETRTQRQKNQAREENKRKQRIVNRWIAEYLEDPDAFRSRITGNKSPGFTKFQEHWNDPELQGWFESKLETFIKIVPGQGTDYRLRSLSEREKEYLKRED